MFRNMIPFDKKELKKYSFGFSYLRNILLSYLLLKSMKKQIMLFLFQSLVVNT